MVTFPVVPAGTMPAQVVGHVVFTFPRTANKLPLPLEELNNLRPIGGPVANLDLAGQSYIQAQEQIMAQQIVNLKEFQFAAMLRGSYTYYQVGDRLIHSFSGGPMTINYQIPASNLNYGVSAVDNSTPLIQNGTLWSNPAATIVDDLFAINASMEAGCGRGLQHIWCRSTVWSYVTKNTQVQTQAGSANVVFDRINSDGDNGFIGVLRAVPWLQWHITDGGLNLDTSTGSGYSYQTLFENNTISCMPEPDPSWVSYYEGSEPVVEWVGRSPEQRYGSYFWAKPIDDPAGYELHNVHNGIPALKVPAAVYHLTVA